MKTKSTDNIKLGAFVFAGMLFLIITLYMIGENRNLFGGTFKLIAQVSDVNGLVAGNNVRFKGMDVGTIESIAIIDDTTIHVTMIIDNEMKPYIRNNSIASIGTDGLMGNKLINIYSPAGPSSPALAGTIIRAKNPIETDEMLRTLNTTNNNMQHITSNLSEITSKLNHSNSLWNLLSDTLITIDLKHAVSAFRKAGANASTITYTTNQFVSRLNSGKGLINKIFIDTALSDQLDSSMNKIHLASQNTLRITRQLDSLTRMWSHGQGMAQFLFTDTISRIKLQSSMTNIEQGTFNFNQNMEALKSNFLFRKYYEKQSKSRKK